MDAYHIEDMESGVQLLVEGDSEPTQDDAHELVGHELDFLRTNLHQFPGGKFILDVGPLAETIESDDKLRASIDRIDAYFASVGKTNLPNAAGFVSNNGLPTRQVIANTMKPGTLLLIGHGEEGEKGFRTEDGDHKFTMQNIAAVLGGNKSSVSNIINAGCFGGCYAPDDYSRAFPAASRISHIATNAPNNLNLNMMKSGQFFKGSGTNALEVMEWQRSGDAWKPFVKTSPEIPDNPIHQTPLTNSVGLPVYENWQ